MEALVLAVTGASGRLGREVVDLLRSGHRQECRLLTRDPDRLRGELDDRFDVVRADFDDPASLAPALRDVTELILIPSADPDDVRDRQSRDLASALAGSDVRHVVYMSFVSAALDADAPHAAVHAATERRLREAVPSATFLRNNVYADAATMLGQIAIVSGHLRLPAGDGRVAFISRRDIARAAVAALGHAGGARALTLTGPAAYGCADLAAIAAAVSGRPVAYDDASPEEARAWLAPLGAPAPLVDMIVGAAQAWAIGMFAAVSPDFAVLTGSDAQAAPEVWREQIGADGGAR